MRQIRIEDLKDRLPSNWEETAIEARKAARTAAAKARAVTIDVHQKVWSSLKDQLRALSYKKCWYCESKDVRSDNAVDHYRPKNRVHEAQETHDGYWWLAFEWSNYRFTCTFCNSRRTSVDGTKGGKADHFPLHDENKRALKAGTERDEFPMLLDPVADLDYSYLWFLESGEVVPKFEEKENKLLHDRAAISIDKYHLHHPDLIEGREKICNSVRYYVERADEQIKELGEGTIAANKVLNERVRELKVFLAPTTQYSSAARCMLIELSKTYKVAQMVLL
jgi:uncharacterized protein (TIGR02646 family)